MIELRVAKLAATSGGLLSNLLSQQGLRVTSVAGTGEAVVSYGLQIGTERPGLNTVSGHLDKYEELVALTDAHIPVPKFWRADIVYLADEDNASFPLIARCSRHKDGDDIQPVLQLEDTKGRIANGAEYFTEFIPSCREYRVGVFRGKHLATYLKELTNPEKCKGIGRTFRNGYSMTYLETDARPQGLTELAAKAVAAVHLDFGAVDIIEDQTGRFVVLEVNSAPGVQSERSVLLRNLTKQIAAWAEAGYPGREDA